MDQNVKKYKFYCLDAQHCTAKEIRFVPVSPVKRVTMTKSFHLDVRISGFLRLQQRKEVENARHSKYRNHRVSGVIPLTRVLGGYYYFISVRFSANIFGASCSASSQKENRSSNKLVPYQKNVIFKAILAIHLFYVAGIRLSDQIIPKSVKRNTMHLSTFLLSSLSFTALNEACIFCLGEIVKFFARMHSYILSRSLRPRILGHARFA